MREPIKWNYTGNSMSSCSHCGAVVQYTTGKDRHVRFHEDQEKIEGLLLQFMMELSVFIQDQKWEEAKVAVADLFNRMGGEEDGRVGPVGVDDGAARA